MEKAIHESLKFRYPTSEFLHSAEFLVIGENLTMFLELAAPCFEKFISTFGFNRARQRRFLAKIILEFECLQARVCIYLFTFYFLPSFSLHLLPFLRLKILMQLFKNTCLQSRKPVM